jgi:excisionase family DNA binding protein
MVTVAQTVTAVEAAQMLGVDRHTVLRLRDRGDLSHVFKADGRTGIYLFARADVERLRDEREKAAVR